MTEGVSPDFDSRLLAAALTVLRDHGLAGLTTARLAEALGGSRMTLHRRGITREVVVRRLAALAADEYQRGIWPALTRRASAADRLREALEATCSVADDHADLLVGLYGDDGGIFHATEGQGDGDPVPTRAIFVEPLARILQDGLLDGTLACADPEETATVLFNQVGWTYLALRHGQAWPAARTRELVVGFAVRAVEVR